MKITDSMVLKSNAGYYIGRLCNDPEIGITETVIPYSRESGYYPTHAAAQADLETNNYYRI